jgi:hypothetical protein
MTDDRTVAAGKRSGQPPSLQGNRNVTDGIDALVHSVQAPETHSSGNTVPAQSDPQQLSDGHDSVLSTRNPGNRQVGRGAFISHMGIKAPVATILPPRALNLESDLL